MKILDRVFYENMYRLLDVNYSREKSILYDWHGFKYVFDTFSKSTLKTLIKQLMPTYRHFMIELSVCQLLNKTIQEQL